MTLKAHPGITSGSYMWDDVQGNVALAKLPSTNPAGFEEITLAGLTELTTLGFDHSGTENATFIVQTPHSMILESELEFHVHYTVEGSTYEAGVTDKFKFRLDVVAAGVDEAFASAGTELAVEHTMTEDYAGDHKLLSLGSYSGKNTTVSSLFLCKLTRVAASGREFDGKVYVLYVDCHVKKDSNGSITEYTKET